MDARYTPADWREALARVRSFRAAMIAKYGQMPDAATLTVERREARLLRLMDVIASQPQEPPEEPRAAA